MQSRGWWNVEFTYTVAKKIKAPVLNPPKSGMFFPPSLEGTIGYWKPSPLNVLYHWQWQSTMMVGSLHQWHLLPHSIVLPGSPCSSSSLTGLVPCQPPMHLMSTSSLPSGHCTQETSLNATHIRTCKRPSSSTHSSSRLSLTASAWKSGPVQSFVKIWQDQDRDQSSQVEEPWKTGPNRHQPVQCGFRRFSMVERLVSTSLSLNWLRTGWGLVLEILI